MPKASKPGYYAVRKGRVPGIYLTWEECEAQVKGFMGSVHKKLSTEAEAQEFMAAKSSVATTSSVARTSLARDNVPSTSTSRSAIASDSKTTTNAAGVVASVPDDEKDCEIVYSDGACKGNGKVGSIAGIGVWWGHGDSRNLAERCPGDQTNNRAELVAIVRILETAPPLKRRLLIKSDSHYSIQCVTSWIFSWMRNGFVTSDGKPVKNRAVIKYLAALLHVRRKTGQTVDFKHVRGHVGIEGNEAADQLANLGATKPAVPERDWDKLEEEVLLSLKPVKAKVDDDELKAYAEGLLNDDDLAALPDSSSISRVVPPRQLTSLRPEERTSRNIPPSVPPVPRERASSSVVNPDVKTVPGAAIMLPSGRATSLRSKSNLPERDGSFESLSTTKSRLPPVQSAPPAKGMVALSEQELKEFAFCLLTKDKFNDLGKDGTFYSEF